MISAAEQSDLVPSGKLRVGIMYTNPVTVAREPASGALSGIAVDLAHELGRHIGAGVELVGYETTAGMLADLHRDIWDAAFTAIAPGHAQELSFTAPYIETEGTYLVPALSSSNAIADVDRQGIRIAVSEKSSLDLLLSGALRHARLVRVPGANAAFELLLAGKADLLAGLRQQLVRVAPRLPGSRVLDGRFMVIQQGVATAKEKQAGAGCLRAFIEQVKASGVVSELIRKNGLTGLQVAPASAAAL